MSVVGDGGLIVKEDGKWMRFEVEELSNVRRRNGGGEAKQKFSVVKNEEKSEREKKRVYIYLSGSIYLQLEENRKYLVFFCFNIYGKMFGRKKRRKKKNISSS